MTTLETELLEFLRADELWWSLDTILDAYHDAGPGAVQSALDDLTAQGLVNHDNQNPPWYYAIAQHAPRKET